MSVDIRLCRSAKANIHRYYKVFLHCGSFRNLIGRTYEKYKVGLPESQKTMVSRYIIFTNPMLFRDSPKNSIRRIVYKMSFSDMASFRFIIVKGGHTKNRLSNCSYFPCPAFHSIKDSINNNKGIIDFD